MVEKLNVGPDSVLPTVLHEWHHMDSSNIAETADRLRRWSADEKLTQIQFERYSADAEITMSLAKCKMIADADTTDKLLDVWARVMDSGGDESFGGMIHGEQSKHYKKAMAFIVTLFEPHFAMALDREFERLALKANSLPTPEKREDAFGDASTALTDLFEDFGTHSKKFAKRLSDKLELLGQLATAEERED
jgi:hypothetical protein